MLCLKPLDKLDFLILFLRNLMHFASYQNIICFIFDFLKCGSFVQRYRIYICMDMYLCLYVQFAGLWASYSFNLLFLNDIWKFSDVIISDIYVFSSLFLLPVILYNIKLILYSVLFINLLRLNRYIIYSYFGGFYFNFYIFVDFLFLCTILICSFLMFISQSFSSY